MIKKSFDLLGSEITLKDLIQYLVIIVSMVVFITNMNNRIDNLTNEVIRLNMNIEKKDSIDQHQDKRILDLEKGVLLMQQILRISPVPSQ